MKANSLPCGEFDLKGFATAIVDGSQCITQADDVDAGPLVEDETEEAVRLIESCRVRCADGMSERNSCSVRGADPTDYGFLISKQGTEFSIQPAFEIDSVLRFEPQSDCDLFNERMERFCRRFIRERKTEWKKGPV